MAKVGRFHPGMSTAVRALSNTGVTVTLLWRDKDEQTRVASGKFEGYEMSTGAVFFVTDDHSYGIRMSWIETVTIAQVAS